LTTASKVTLTKEKETLLITLYAKAMDYRSKTSILNDQKADEILSALDYNFDKLSDDNGNITVVRVKQLDDWTKKFLNGHKNAVVLHLGCGLDTRISRIKPPPTVSWFDVDYPQVIELRKKFFAEKAGYKMISSSLTSSKWLKEIPEDRPTIIVAEGVLEYMTREQVKVLLGKLIDHFANGQIAFDVLSSFAINSGRSELKKQTGARHKWAVDDLLEVDRLNPRLERIDELSVFESKYVRKLPVKYRRMYASATRTAPYKDMLRLLLYQF
jgi:O-methyltransferase involved in polyketide biosynthesis